MSVPLLSNGPTEDLTVVLDRAYLKKVFESFLIFLAIFLSSPLFANLTTLLALFACFYTLLQHYDHYSVSISSKVCVFFSKKTFLVDQF